jgi:hypothetical protein
MIPSQYVPLMMLLIITEIELCTYGVIVRTAEGVTIG